MKPLMAAFAFLLVLSGCGYEHNSSTLSENMTEDDAFDILKSVPMNDGETSAFGRRRTRRNVSATRLVAMIKEIAESGAMDHHSNVRKAMNNGGMDLSGLTTLFSVLNNGNVNNVFGLAAGLASAGTGDGTLDSILGIINAVLPIISAIAPQFAPILQALTVIIPLIVSLFGGFGKSVYDIHVGGPEFAKIAPLNLFVPKLA